MTTNAPITKHFSILYWSEIAKWTPTASMLRYLYLNIPKDWGIKRVGDLIFQLSEKHPVEANKFYKLVGVKWYGGGVFCRENVKGIEISAKYLYPLIPNAFIYNRLFAWKESFAVVPETFSGYYVSNEFPQFSVNNQEIIPEFLCLIFLTKKVIKAVNSASVGSSAISRNRFSENEFLNFYVPVPPLQIQQAVVGYWKKAKRELAIQEAKLRGSVDELNLILLQLTCSYSKLKNSRFFIADFSRVLRWDVKSGRSAAFRKSNPNFVRLGDFAEECTELVRPWEEPEKEWPVYGVNNETGVFLNYYQRGKAFNVAYKKIRKNWFFHNPTRANVGSLGIVPDVPNDAITSPEYQVWRLTGGFLPEFMALMLQTEYFLSLVDFNRVGAVKQRMYYANLAEIRLPLLDEDVQLRFANEWRTNVANLLMAEQNLKKAQVEIEEMILGNRLVEGV
jgi:hypothetical protein